ncbi:MAG: hypothetical protein ACLTDR_05845 [Adlercreutzia equolifaciens]
MKADEASIRAWRARRPSTRRAAGELDAAKKKVSDLDAVYRDLGVRRGSLERELSALSKDAEKMTAERETARRRHAENTEALSHGPRPRAAWWRARRRAGARARARQRRPSARRPGPPRPMASFPRWWRTRRQRAPPWAPPCSPATRPARPWTRPCDAHRALRWRSPP